jgi:hypothetical protein
MILIVMRQPLAELSWHLLRGEHAAKLLAGFNGILQVDGTPPTRSWPR